MEVPKMMYKSNTEEMVTTMGRIT